MIWLVVRNRVTVFQMPAIVAKLHESSPYYLNKFSKPLM